MPTIVVTTTTTTTVPAIVVTTTTTPPTRPRLAVPGLAAPKNLTILTPQQQVDSTKIVAEYLQTLERQNESPAAKKLRDAVTAAAPALGAAIADAVTRLAKTLEDKNSTQLEIVGAKAAVADASAKTILIALDATNGNTKSLALPVTKAAKLPDLNPGKALIISPTSSEFGKLSVVANTTAVLSSTKENLSLAMTAIDTTGDKVPINKNNSINVDHGQSLAMTGSGFKPNSEVKVWMFSNPRSIGTVITDANGSFAAEVPLPDNIVPGEHTAQVNGNNKSGGMRSLNLGLEVDLPAESPSKLPATTISSPTRARNASVFFRGDDSKMFWGTISQLKKILPKIRQGRTVKVIGYAHSPELSNNKIAIELSRQRAENVAMWLRQRKIKVVEVKASGYSPSASRARPLFNRRVTIYWSD
jgi:outer membrane protein OmpA-like peptidoglycan-associated protein